MTAFLKIERCRACSAETPWEWSPPIVLGGKALAGTGVWRSPLVDGLCPRCWQAAETDRERIRQFQQQRQRLIDLLGGIKPYREFTFERFQVFAGNREAFERARRFDPLKDNLYLWGPGRFGKTHLGIGIARTCFERGGAVSLTTPLQLVRKLRMKPPEEEQRTIGDFVRADILLLDDFGMGYDTAYARLVLREILDARDFKGCGGLVVASRYRLGSPACRQNDDAIAARLAEMCRVVEIKGLDRRAIQCVQRDTNSGTKDCLNG
jgi:DNA replication protein DnaC